MKKEYKVFSLLFILLLLVILASLYIAKRGLIETPKQPEGTEAQKISAYPAAVSTETPSIKAESEEKKIEQKAKKEEESDLSQISQDTLKEIEKNPPQEETPAGEKKLNTQPSLQKLKELKTKGAVIY